MSMYSIEEMFMQSTSKILEKFITFDHWIGPNSQQSSEDLQNKINGSKDRRFKANQYFLNFLTAVL